MKIYGVQSCEIDAYWPVIEPFVSRPIEKTGIDESFGSEYVLEKLREAKMQCWLIHKDTQINAAVITKIDTLPRRKILTVVFAGAVDGEVESWVDVVDHLKKFAKSIECSIVRITGRKGWEKVLKPKAVRIEFDLEV